MTGHFIDMLQPALDGACAAIRRKRARFVGVQLPDGLRSRFRELAAFVERGTGARVAMLVEMCCGACMAEVPPGFDAVVHVAHDGLRLPGGAGAGLRNASGGPEGIFYIPYTPAVEVDACVGAALPLLRPPVGILTTSTHAGLVPRVVELLRESGMGPLLATGKRTGRKAVVLGCDLSAARKLSDRAGSFLFIGSGAFHPVGVELATGKPVVGADPFGGRARTFSEEKNRILRRRFAAIELARGARVFGVMLGLYPGQSRRGLAVRIKRMLEEEGKEAYLLAARRFDPESVAHLGLEALVSTACSRIALDDTARYPLPVLSPPELDIVLGRRRWEEYRPDEMG